MDLRRLLIPAIAAALLGGCADRPADEPAPARPAATSSRPLGPGEECAVDDDCALLPYVTCCGECYPDQPLRVGTRAQADAVYLEAEFDCGRSRAPCTPPVCDPWPPGCFAKASCVAGTCTLVTDGCGLP